MPQTVRTRVDWADGSFTDVEITRSITRNTVTTRTYTTHPPQQGNVAPPATSTEDVSPAAPQTTRPSTSVTSSNTRPRTPNNSPTASSHMTGSRATPITPTPVPRSTQPSARSATSSTPRSSRHSAAVPNSPSLTSVSSVSGSLVAERTDYGIPHPQDLVQPSRVNGSKFYVVFAGTRVGIFGNWYGEAKPYTHGISGSHQKSYSQWNEAREAYSQAYFGHSDAPRLAILGAEETDSLNGLMSGLEV